MTAAVLPPLLRYRCFYPHEALSLMIIGEHTNGIFSYQYDQRLPNGWKFYLSNQQYFSPNMVCYEGRGVPVDIEHLNTRADLEKNVDSLLIKAFEILRLPPCAQL